MTVRKVVVLAMLVLVGGHAQAVADDIPQLIADSHCDVRESLRDDSQKSLANLLVDTASADRVLDAYAKVRADRCVDATIWTRLMTSKIYPSDPQLKTGLRRIEFFAPKLRVDDLGSWLAVGPPHPAILLPMTSCDGTYQLLRRAMVSWQTKDPAIVTPWARVALSCMSPVSGVDSIDSAVIGTADNVPDVTLAKAAIKLLDEMRSQPAIFNSPGNPTTLQTLRIIRAHAAVALALIPEVVALDGQIRDLVFGALANGTPRGKPPTVSKAVMTALAAATDTYGDALVSALDLACRLGHQPSIDKIPELARKDDTLGAAVACAVGADRRDLLKGVDRDYAKVRDIRTNERSLGVTRYVELLAESCSEPDATLLAGVLMGAISRNIAKGSYDTRARAYHGFDRVLTRAMECLRSKGKLAGIARLDALWERLEESRGGPVTIRGACQADPLLFAAFVELYGWSYQSGPNRLPDLVNDACSTFAKTAARRAVIGLCTRKLAPPGGLIGLLEKTESWDTVGVAAATAMKAACQTTP